MTKPIEHPAEPSEENTFPQYGGLMAHRGDASANAPAMNTPSPPLQQEGGDAELADRCAQRDRHIDQYWASEAAKAYEERRLAVREALRLSSGYLLPWMRFQITGRDLKAEYDRYWFGAQPLTNPSSEHTEEDNA